MTTQIVQMKMDMRTLKNVQRNFSLLPAKLLTGPVAKAANKAMTIVLKAARAKVSQASANEGTLEESLGKKKMVYKKAEVVAVYVGPRPGHKDPDTGANPVNYAHLFEEGVEPHVIKAPSGGLMIGGKVIIRGAVEHPGYQGEHFLKESLYENSTAVINKYTTDLAQQAEKAVAALGRKR